MTKSRKTKKGLGDLEYDPTSSSDEDKTGRKRPSETSDEENRDSSSDEIVRFLPTKYRNLKNILIRTSELQIFLSCKSYRLRDQSPKFTTKCKTNSVELL
jgi:hypothetical protein